MRWGCAESPTAAAARGLLALTVAALVAECLHSGPMRAFERTLETEGERGLIRMVERRRRIGRGAAVATAASAVLPALHAFAARGDADRRGRAEEAFRRMPAPPSDSVVRGVSAALGIRVRPKLAIEHFGLHELARASSWHGGASSVSGESPRAAPARRLSPASP